MDTALLTKRPSSTAAAIARPFHELRPANATSSLAAGSVRSYAKDDEIFADGQRAAYVYKVVSGAVRTSKLLIDGRRQIDAFHLPGDIFGIESDDDYRFCAEAIDNCMVVAYRRSQIESLSGTDTQLVQQFAVAMMRTLVRAQNHLLLLGRKTALEKIATFLLDLAERLPAGDTLDLPMSRTDIADHLGLTIETVSRCLAQLEKRAVIKMLAARRIVLSDKTALQRLND
jgi:CRP/FNR family transcriptional regulator, nitrogen fixation regulation protein